MKKEKGSITLFSLLSLLLVTAFLFGLLEGTRLQEMRRFAMLQTETAIESTFANYNTCLWKSYRLLGTNRNRMDETLEKVAKGRMGKGTNFLQLEPTKICITGDIRITDGEGLMFIASVTDYMKENLIFETAKEVYNQYEAIKQILEQNKMDLSHIKEALEIPMNEKKERTRNRDVSALLESAEKWMKMGILQLVIEDTGKISEGKQDFTKGLLQRNLEKGSVPVEYCINWMDRVLLQQYLLTYLSSYTKEQDNRALSYELEYLLGKNSSDIENLKETANRLLGVREAVNFLYLLSDATSVAQAEAMAILLAGATASPALIQVVKMGLLTAWALAESILDVRALLVGKRIPLLKSQESWTVDLENLSTIADGFPMAKESKWGLTYKDYLGILLLLEDEASLAMHSMNLQEATIRKNDMDPNFCMDRLLIEACVAITYTYEPVFPFLRKIDAEERWERRISTTAAYGYYGEAGIKG